MNTKSKSIITVGHVCWDSIYQTQKLPQVGAKCRATNVSHEIGGHAGRTALALADVADVSCITVFGSSSEDSSRQILQTFAAKNIEFEHSVFTSENPAHSSIWVTPDGERTIAAYHTSDQAVDQDRPMFSADAALFDLTKPKLNESVRARLPNCSVRMLDVDTPVDDLDLLQGYSHVWFSWETAQMLNDNPVDLARRLDCVVGITRGGRPVVYWDKATGYPEYTINVDPVDSSNTTGAGDWWRACLAYHLVMGRSLFHSVLEANKRTALWLTVGSTIA